MHDLLKIPLRLLVPVAFRRWLKFKLQGENYIPAVGAVRFGDLRRVTPICRDFGRARGGVVDRYYVANFLESHQTDIRGRVLEIGDRNYTTRFGGGRVTQSDVLHAVPGNPEATIVGDLPTGENVPVGAFDCVILTQTLNIIYDFRGSLKHATQALKPGGVLLATVPGIAQLSRYDLDRGWGDHWRFTILSATKIFHEVFPAGAVTTREYGNVLAAAAFLYGISQTELTRAELDYLDPEYPMIIGLRAVNPG